MGGLSDRSAAELPSEGGEASAAPLVGGGEGALPFPPVGEGERLPSPPAPTADAAAAAAFSSMRSASAALARWRRKLRPSAAATKPMIEFKRDNQGDHLEDFSLAARIALLR